MTIRKAGPNDLGAIVALSEEKRTQYEPYQPQFWRKAPDSAATQLAFLQGQIQRENLIALVHERPDGVVDGFVIAALVPAPPVYAPGGLTCAIDDYWVAGGADWQGVGTALLDEAARLAKERGAAQVVVVTAGRDESKRAMLQGKSFTLASEWWVRSV